MVKLREASIRRASALLLVAAAIFAVVWDEISSPLLYSTLQGNTNYYPTATAPLIDGNIYIPPSLDPDRARSLSQSINLGGGNCKWMPPAYDVPEDEDFHKTLVVGFPSGDKRMVYLQMEALAGYSAKDEWDFAYMGMTNNPFIKANYPHHEGIWGWGDVADQVVMIVPNIRRSMVEYHDILYDLGYATTWEEANAFRDNLYESQPDIHDYYQWRDSRVTDEAHWYGWFIDYWMEGGLMRDVFSHELTTKEHWDDLTLKPFYTRAELDISNYVPEGTIVTPTYDTHCSNSDISGGCEPIAVVSADRLRGNAGRLETSTIASALKNDDRTGDHVIDEEAWNCIWRELIQNKKGPKVMSDRPGYQGIEWYNFSTFMLEEMLSELNRLITKYSGIQWNETPTAIRLVEILEGHRTEIEKEHHQVITGQRRLQVKDYLGPERNIKGHRELRRRQGQNNEEAEEDNAATSRGLAPKKDHTRFFIALEQKRFENKRRGVQGAKEKEASEKSPQEETMSDVDFVEALSNALSHIRKLEAAGGMSKETAAQMVDRVRKVSSQARVMMMKEK